VDEGKLIIAGYASVEIIDSQKELIPLAVLKEAWDKFSENEDFMIGTLMHSNIPVIKILKEYTDSKGELWKSGVDDTGLFIVALVNDTIEKGKQARELIEKGALAGFSIGGEALASSVHCEGKCFTRIDKMELHEIAVVDKPANKASVFTIVKRLKENKKEDEKMSKSEDEVEKSEEIKKPFIFNLDVSKIDKALEIIDKRTISKPFAGYKDFADCERQNQDKRDPGAYCATIQEAVEKLDKQQEKPPKAQWDRCEDKARGIASIDDPAAFCGNLWYNDRSKWNAFIKEEKKKSECGCPVNKTITAKSIKKLDNTLKLIEETQKKKPNKKVNK